MKINKIFLSAAILFFAISAKADINADNNLLQVHAVIQISSVVSDGKYSIQEIIEIARKNNARVILLTDRDFMNWEYGLWPFERIIKKKIETSSISGYGMEKYFNEVEELQKKNPDIVLIGGVETAPFYYWKGGPFNENFKIVDWHKHMLIFGLSKPIDYKNIPSVSNKNGLRLPFTIKDIYRLWPVLILIIGVLCLRKREFNYKDHKGNLLSPYSLPWQIFGGMSLVVGLIFTINNYPFRGLKYDQYHGGQGIAPYQNLINYVNQKGGMAFWAHPEIENINLYNNIKTETKEYPEYVLESRNYTGFTYFYEGDEKVGSPGGIWDRVLKEYCMGLRNRPVWAIGGFGFDQTGDFNEEIKYLKTVFLTPRINKEAILDALRNGKMYVVRGRDSKDFILDSFIIKDSLSDIEGTIADEITLKGKPIISISGRIINGKDTDKVKVKLIKNGVIIKIFNVDNIFDINFIDEEVDEDKKNYYRIEINAPNRDLVVNPIFINFKV